MSCLRFLPIIIGSARFVIGKCKINDEKNYPKPQKQKLWQFLMPLNLLLDNAKAGFSNLVLFNLINGYFVLTRLS